MTATLHVLSIDPGPTWSGWCHLRVEHTPGARTTYVAGGMILSERAPLKRLLAEINPGLVGIETPCGYAFEAFRVPPLLATAAIAGGMKWICEERDIRVITATAQQVRKLLAGKANANDDVVRHTVRAQVFGCPETGKDHVADAIAMGVVGAWISLSKAVMPPEPVSKKKRVARSK